jgi:excisionase family DNA binding protein
LSTETVYLIAGDIENGTERQEMQPMDVTQEWVSYPEAEKYCRLSHTTLWRYVKTGEIRAARVGRSVRIHLPSLKRFMEGRATEDGDATTEGR